MILKFIYLSILRCETRGGFCCFIGPNFLRTKQLGPFFVNFPWWDDFFFATTMDNTLLFAYCITDGELDNFTEQQKKSILHVINNIKDAMLLENDHRKNETK